MNKFDEIAQKVWTTTNLAEKKAFLLEMVSNFRYKGKFNENVGKFTRQIENCNSARRLDDMAAQLMLNATDKVIK